METKKTEVGKLGWTEFLTRAAAAMTLGLPVLYLIGLSFDQGYQAAFSVPELVRSGDFHNRLTMGFVAIGYSVPIIHNWMRDHWPAMVIFSVSAGAVTAIGLWHENSIRRSYQRIHTWLGGHQDTAKSLKVIRASLFAFFVPYIFTTMLLLMLTLPFLGYIVGTKVAQQHMKKQAPTCEIAAANQNKFNRCVTARHENEVIRGYMISATSNYFVIAENGRTRAIPIEGWQFEDTYRVGAK